MPVAPLTYGTISPTATAWSSQTNNASAQNLASATRRHSLPHNGYLPSYLTDAPVSPPLASGPALYMPAEVAADLKPFANKLKVYAHEMVNASYGPANASILLGIAGLGITNGSYMVLLKDLGSEGSSLPVFGFMGLTAMSMILSGASKTYTSHQRDNQDLIFSGIVDDVTAAQYCHDLVRCGIATTGTNAALLVGTAAYAQGRIGSATLLGVSIVAKSVEACLKGIELGYWNCIKTYLGDSQSLYYQRSLNRTIVGLESITQAVVYNACTAGTYFVVNSDRKNAENINGVMLSLFLGCAVILSSNLYFNKLAKVMP